MKKYVCKRCGGTKIQMLAWIDPNTKEYISDTEYDDGADTWCDYCEDHIGFKTKNVKK